MRWDAHKAAVTFVNKALNEPFPENALLDGSVEPDYARLDYNTYSYGNHHFSSDNDRTVITSKITNYICAARQNWLRNDKSEAAFQFGIASHFFLDGFITSPKVSQSKHDHYEKLMSDYIIQIGKVPEDKIVETNIPGSKKYAKSILKRFEYDYGKMDNSSLPRALGALYELGKMITLSLVYDPSEAIELAKNMVLSFDSFTNETIADFHLNSKQLIDEQISKRLHLLHSPENAKSIILDIIDRRIVGWDKALLIIFQLTNKLDFVNNDAENINRTYLKLSKKYKCSLESKYNQYINELTTISSYVRSRPDWYIKYERPKTIEYISKINLIQENFNTVLSQETKNYSSNIQDSIKSQDQTIFNEFFAEDKEKYLWPSEEARNIGKRTATGPMLEYILSYSMIVFFVFSLIYAFTQKIFTSVFIIDIVVFFFVLIYVTNNFALAARWRSLYKLSDTEWVSKWKKQ